MCDFDDTLFSRKQQLETNNLLFSNRWDAGIEVIINQIGMEKFIQDYVANISFPSDISKLLDPKKDIILTAGTIELQMAKIQACKLDFMKTIITLNGQDKIIACIRYILFDLKYIPKSITIYEDRPEYFIEYRELIEDVLSTKLIIKKVIMNGNDEYKEIKDM